MFIQDEPSVLDTAIMGSSPVSPYSSSPFNGSKVN